MKLKKLSSVFVSLLLILTMIAPVYAENLIDVTLRVESIGQTICPKTEVQLENRNDLTVQDVLNAAHVEYEEVDSIYGKYITSIGGYNGNGWMYVLSNDIDGYNYPAIIEDDVDLVFYEYVEYYLYFEKEEYKTTVDESIELTLNGKWYDDSYNTIKGTVSNIEILAKKSDEKDYSSLNAITDKNGKVSIQFDEPGTYDIVTKADEKHSRAYAKIIVTGEASNKYETINKTIATFNIPSSTDGNLELPTYSSIDWGTIVWTSSNPDVITNNGIVHRGEVDQSVILTAEVYDSAENSKTVSFEVTVLADSSLYDAGELKPQDNSWLNAGYNQAITNTKTAIKSKEVSEKWINRNYKYVSSPIIVGDYVYVINSKSQLVKLDKSGEVKEQANLNNSLSYITDICYGDGMIFVPLANGSIQAFNESNLSSLWVSKPLNSMVTSKLTYYDGYVYGGTMNGIFFALNVKDGNTNKGYEEKDYTWTYQTKDRNGYYSNQAKVIGDNIYFAGDNGILVSHDLVSNKVNKTVSLGDSVRSGITYDGEYLYIMDMSSTLYKINPNTLKIVNQVTLYDNGYSTSTPTIYNGRIYVGGNQDEDALYDANKGFIAIVDAKTMKVVASQETEGEMKAMPLVTTAYANEGNKNAVAVYFTCNTYPGGVYSFIDYEGNTKINIEKLYIPEASYQQYNMNSVCVDDEGILYFVNDSGALFALKNTNENASITIKSETVEGNKTNSNQVVTETNKTTVTPVNTGDNTSITPYVVAGVIAIVVLIGVCYSSFKKNKTKK